MFTHINVKNESAIIKEKFKDSLSMFIDSNELIFFNIINFLGCYVSALFKSAYSASDCCSTVESIENIFNVKYDTDNLNIKGSGQLKEIFALPENYLYKFRVMPKGMPFHTFIVIKYKNKWIIIQSFFGICGLHVNEDHRLPVFLSNFIQNPTGDLFNILFEANLQEQITADDANMTISYAKFTELPLEKLRLLIMKFMENSNID